MRSRETVLRLKRFQVEERRRQVAQIEATIGEFEKVARELDRQIAAEQERTGIADASHFAYSTFAKAAKQRRDNLSASAGELKGQLEAAQALMATAVEELEKLELIAERDSERERAEPVKVDHHAGGHARRAAAG